MHIFSSLRSCLQSPLKQIIRYPFHFRVRFKPSVVILFFCKRLPPTIRTQTVGGAGRLPGGGGLRGRLRRPRSASAHPAALRPVPAQRLPARRGPLSPGAVIELALFHVPKDLTRQCRVPPVSGPLRRVSSVQKECPFIGPYFCFFFKVVSDKVDRPSSDIVVLLELQKCNADDKVPVLVRWTLCPCLERRGKPLTEIVSLGVPGAAVADPDAVGAREGAQEPEDHQEPLLLRPVRRPAAVRPTAGNNPPPFPFYLIINPWNVKLKGLFSHFC